MSSLEIRDWAIRILSSEALEDKLFAPLTLTDHNPGPAILWKEPARAPEMMLRKKARGEKLPAFHEHGEAEKRVACLHRFAGHELLAVEIMAYTLLAFPDALPSFRKGVAATLQEEQGHVRLYLEQVKRLGAKFGDFPLYRHFWAHTPFITSPLHYVSIMGLTFEMANLDFAPMYGKSFARHGDKEAAALMATILRDEIAHVRFGYRWLCRMKPEEQGEWDAWEKTLSTTLLTPQRAKGFLVHAEPRRAAGIPEEWITKIEAS